MGAEKVDELDNANRLLDNVRGLDAASIRNAARWSAMTLHTVGGKIIFHPLTGYVPANKWWKTLPYWLTVAVPS